MVDYIHAGVFVPLIGPRDGHTERFSFSASSNPSLRLKYWDDGAYVSELELVPSVEDTKPVATKETPNATDPNKEGLIAVTSDEGSGKSKKRKGDANVTLGTKKVSFYTFGKPSKY